MLLFVVQERTLVMAVRHDHLGVLETLYPRMETLLQAEDILKLGSHLLHVAVEYDAASCARFLLDHGVLLDCVNEQSETAVQVACTHGRREILEVLLESYAGDELHSRRGRETPLNTIMLRHYFVEVEILPQFDDTIAILDEIVCWPVRFVPKKPRKLQIMDVLVRHGAKFEFPTSVNRDEVAPLLATWLERIAPDDVSVLLVGIINADCIRHKELEPVISSLMWSKYTCEALVLVLLMLFSSRTAPRLQALAVFELWMSKFGNDDKVVSKLLADALQ